MAEEKNTRYTGMTTEKWNLTHDQQKIMNGMVINRIRYSRTGKPNR
jgi:hypothetical protein